MKPIIIKDLKAGDVVLTHDFISEKWLKVRINHFGVNTISLTGIEGTLNKDTWDEDPDNFTNTDYYRLS